MWLAVDVSQSGEATSLAAVCECGCLVAQLTLSGQLEPGMCIALLTCLDCRAELTTTRLRSLPLCGGAKK